MAILEKSIICIFSLMILLSADKVIAWELIKKDGVFVIVSLQYGGHVEEVHQCTVSASRKTAKSYIRSETFFLNKAPKTIRECASDEVIKKLVDDALEYL